MKANLEFDFISAAKAPESVRSFLRTAFEREFGNVEVVRAHTWAKPNWILLGSNESELTCSCGIVERTARSRAISVPLLGLNNVIVEPQFRGKNLGNELVVFALKKMRSINPNAYGFLFCAENLIPFYEKSGWIRFLQEVTIDQPAGPKVWAGPAMIHPLGKPVAKITEIHLCGLPW